MSFGDSTGVDSGCGSQMSRNSSSVSNFLHDQQQLSPPMSQPMTPYRGQGHFSPNLQVQTGFDSAMSSPMPCMNSPYGNQPMTSSPMPPHWPQQGQGQECMQGSMPVQGSMQGPGLAASPGQMQGHFPQQQQQQMMPPPPLPPPQQQQYHHHHHHHHNHQGQGPMPMRNGTCMSQSGHCPNNNMMNSPSMANTNTMGMPTVGPHNCSSMPSNGGGSPMMTGMQSHPAPMNQWQAQGSLQNLQSPGVGGEEYCQGDMMNGELPGQPFSPVVHGLPMVGRVGMGAQQRGSPQVQVPHISQSQIPPNAKAVSRGMMLRQQMMNPQMQQQQMSSAQQQQQQPIPPQSQLNMYMDNRATSYQSQYRNSAYSQACPEGVRGQMAPPNAVVNGSGTPVHTPAPDFAQQRHRGLMAPPGGASTPTGMFRHPHPPATQPPTSQRVRRSSQAQQPYPYPMEMSPGCNQVTSSTDCKDPTTQTPIEDFMENIKSLSTENLVENIPTENALGSQTSLQNRSVSQNSSRFNPMLNTSNMVVNDMSSILTQLAEENKYLSMRP